MRLSPPRIRVDVAELDALYPEAEPLCLLGDEVAPPLSGVSVFANREGPHWHYVGFVRDPDEHEDVQLTFRLVATERAEPAAAPRWPVLLLSEFAAHAHATARPLAPGQYLCFPRPIDPDGGVRCAALVRDPQLAPDDPAPRYLQLVGLHERELAWISGDGHARLLAALRERAPLLVTDPSRAPIVLD